jgi:hypothetical protein
MAVQIPSQQMPQECHHIREDRLKAEAAMRELQNEYGDPAKGLRKNVERVEVNHDYVDDRMNLKN